MRPTLPFRCALLAAAALAGAAGAATELDVPANQAELIAMLRADAARHEHGEGVQKDGAFAAALYCKAAKLGDADSQFALGWMYTNGRGVDRNDAFAAYFFEAAAEQGVAQAARLLPLVGGPGADTPPCMRDPVVEAPPAPAAEAPKPVGTDFNRVAPRAILDIVKKLAPDFRIQPQLALAVIAAESGFDAAAVSPKNAKGLMQLIPETAERFNVGNPFDAKQNIRGRPDLPALAAGVLRGHLALVAAAYNAGEGTVDRYLGVPPFAETRAYVKRVVDAVGGDGVHPFDRRVTLPSARLLQIREAGMNRSSDLAEQKPTTSRR